MRILADTNIFIHRLSAPVFRESCLKYILGLCT